MFNFYITFGSNHKDKHGNPLEKAFVVIKAKDRWEARKKMFEVRDKSWAFIYSEVEFEGQIKNYNLHKVNLNEL
jgi:hypothetical protein